MRAADPNNECAPSYIFSLLTVGPAQILFHLDGHYSMATEYPSRPKNYGPVGRCIYCWSDQHVGLLGSEHIVAQGLGGRMELLASSCQRHAAITGSVEQQVFRGALYPVRAKLNLLSRKRKKEHPTDWPVLIDYGTHEEPRRIPLSEHPVLLVMFLYDPPGALLSQPMTDSSMIAGKVSIRALNPDAIKGKMTTDIGLDAGTFARMLAKIGHAYAVSQLGLDGFVPSLLRIIDGSSLASVSHFVGGGIESGEGEELHEISLDTIGEHVVVRIRLFASLGMPTYFVVVGTIPRR